MAIDPISLVPDAAHSALPRQRAAGERYLAFVITDNEKPFLTYELRLTPEQYSLDRPVKASVTQTRGGYFIDHFGFAIGTLTMSGTTGWGLMPDNAPGLNPSPTAGRADGFDRWVGLVKFFQYFFVLKQTDPDRRYALQFYNFLEGDWFLIWPLGLPKLSRSVREPLLFRYEMQFSVLAPLQERAYTQSVNASPDDPLGQIAVQTDRAGRIAARLTQQLALQPYLAVWIKNGVDLSTFDPLAFTPAELADLAVDEQDAIAQQFVDALLQRQTPPGFVVPTDSAVGTVGRTRSLVGRLNDYTAGISTTVRSTLGEVEAIANGWRAVLDAADDALGLPVVYQREVRETLCAVQSLLLYPQLFRSTVSASLRALTTLALDSGCATTLRR